MGYPLPNRFDPAPAVDCTRLQAADSGLPPSSSSTPPSFVNWCQNCLRRCVTPSEKRLINTVFHPLSFYSIRNRGLSASSLPNVTTAIRSKASMKGDPFQNCSQHSIPFKLDGSWMFSQASVPRHVQDTTCGMRHAFNIKVMYVVNQWLTSLVLHTRRRDYLYPNCLCINPLFRENKR